MGKVIAAGITFPSNVLLRFRRQSTSGKVSIFIKQTCCVLFGLITMLYGHLLHMQQKEKKENK